MTASGTEFDGAGAHLEAAVGYLARGWSVVPAAVRGKQPIVKWRRFKHRAPSADTVIEWFERWPDANIAVITGQLSGIVVLDIDPKHGGEESIAAMEVRHGSVPETVEAVTGGGGRHLYFAHPGTEVRNRASLAPGVDLRGDGGCIIVPPSVHPSGRRYRWRPGHAPGQLALSPLPIWLEHPRFAEGGTRGHPIDYWRSLVREGVEEGRRNATLASFCGHLLWHEVDPDVVLELLLAWNRIRCRPPLEDDEVIRTVRSIERTHRRQTTEPARG